MKAKMNLLEHKFQTLNELTFDLENDKIEQTAHPSCIIQSAQSSRVAREASTRCTGETEELN